MSHEKMISPWGESVIGENDNILDGFRSPQVNGDLLGSMHRASETLTDCLGLLRSTKSLLENG